MGEVDVKALAAGIANDIRTHGHYQAGCGGELWGLHNPGGQCCVVASPTYRAVDDAPRTTRHGSPYDAMCRALGLHGIGGLSEWNDSHPTADVLAALDGIAGQSAWAA